MRSDRIEAIGFTEAGGLYLRPATERFPFIYREAMEVGWDDTERWLYGPRPREWTILMWFRQIRSAAREQGVELRLSPETCWHGIPDQLRAEILAD